MKQVLADSRRRIIAATVVAQVLVLLVIVALHGARIASGTEVRVPVRPVDPLDLARGAYVELDYGLDVKPPAGARNNDDVYVVLSEPDTNGVRRATRAVSSVDDVRDGELWIKLYMFDDERISTDRISTYYASQEEATRLESELADGGGIAVISLDSEGDPTLVGVEG